jgi:hypothetical protein
MKISARATSAMLLVLQIVAPAMSVVVVRTLSLEGGPSIASAAPAGDIASTSLQPTPEIVMTPEDDKRLANAQRLSGMEISRNPFYSEVFKSTELDIKTLLVEEPTEDDRPIAIEVPDVEVTSLTEGREKIAIINGKVMRIGEAVLEGWTLASIDVNSQSVLLRHSTGIEHEYQIIR